MSEKTETVQALPEGAWVLKPEIFLVPTSPWPDSDLDRQIHAEVQQIVTLIYAMIACGMDFGIIKARILVIEE